MPFKDKKERKAYNKTYHQANKEKKISMASVWQKANKDKHRRNQRKSILKRKYGLTLQEYLAMYKSQGGRCAICGEAKESQLTTKEVLHVDHCHKTGKTRGLLCTKCNKGLGLFTDSVENLNKAIIYLRCFDSLFLGKGSNKI